MSALDKLKSINNPLTRFAPSPTGYLHLGHLAHAIFVWGTASLINGRVILRIEDHDTQRCRPEYIDAIYQDLDFFGFKWDNLSDGVVSDPVQSCRHNILKKYFRMLCQEQLIYGCNCTRKMVEERSGCVDGELCYDGFCRNESLTDPALYRFVVEEANITFDDILLGRQSQNPKHQCGDFAVKDRHNQWTYNFAVSVDDFEQGVNLVIRGEDILHATSRQIVLAKELGRTEPPMFMHHPLIKEQNGLKLSKRFFSESLKERREKGATAAELIGEAAYAVGLCSEKRLINFSEIPAIVKRYLEA
jgi:glutamyl-Q tRNA(Asp) synthetase